MKKYIRVNEYNAMMDEIDKMLTTLFGSSKSADEWWYEDNYVFGLKSPMMVYFKDPDFVYKFVSDAFNKKCQK